MKKAFTFFSTLIVAISLATVSVVAQTPSLAAPIPPARTTAKVISIYSNSYTNVAGTNFNPSWQQATQFLEVSVVGNSTLKFANLNYQGFELGSSVNALPMTHLHIDVWTADETSLKISPISPGKELLVELTPLTLNSWNSFDIPLSEFLGVNMSDVFQFKIVGSGGKTVFVDNLYFYDISSVVDTEAPTAFTATAGLVTFNSVELLLKASDNKGAIDYEIKYGATTVHTSCFSGGSKSFTVDLLAGATNYNFYVTAKDLTGNGAANGAILIPVTTYPIAPKPSNAMGKVISIFSDAFTNIAGTIFTPNWQQATIATIVTANSNSALKYANLNYQGIELGSHVNALSMTHLHLDVWTTNETVIDFSVLSPGREKSIALPISNFNSWNGFDIPLSSLTDVVLSDIFQFKIVGTGGKTIYIDNLYFYDDSAEDSMSPTNFSAAIGLVTFNSVELLLNATDNRGAINYQIKYGAKTVTTSGISGITKSFTLDLLAGATNYSFSISASDGAGNMAANNPLIVDTITYPAAPIPTLLPAKVISLFSDTYTNVASTIFNPNWNQATISSIIAPNGNSVLKYTNLNYQGTELGSHVDANAMNTVHVDTWSADETSLTFSIISPGQERTVTLEPLNTNVWNSFDLPLTLFSGVVLTDIFQLKVVGSGGKTVYLDNIYFCDTPDLHPPQAFTATKGVTSYSSVELLLKAYDNSGSVSYEISYGATTLTSTGVSGVQQSVIIESLVASTNYSFSVKVKDAAGNVAVNNPIVVSATTQAIPPAAPIPSVAAILVKSIFSNSYTNLAGINFNVASGQSTVYSSVIFSSNAAIHYGNLNYQNVAFASDVKINSMSFLHLDVYTHDETMLKVFLLSAGVEKAFELKPLLINSWNSFDIPLTAFSGVDFTAVQQMKFEGSGGKSVYLDNIFFYTLPTSTSNILAAKGVQLYPNPALNEVSIVSSNEINVVEISNLFGQIVRTETVSGHQVKLDISNLPRGNYFVIIKDVAGHVITQKLIKC